MIRAGCPQQILEMRPRFLAVLHQRARHNAGASHIPQRSTTLRVREPSRGGGVQYSQKEPERDSDCSAIRRMPSRQEQRKAERDAAKRAHAQAAALVTLGNPLGDGRRKRRTTTC